MKHSVPHDLTLDLAQKAATKALESYKERFAEYNPTIRWRDTQNADVAFAVKGMNLTGSFTVHTDRIDMDMEVPLLMRPFKAKALEVIEREIQKWLEKAKKGELG